MVVGSENQGGLDYERIGVQNFGGWEKQCAVENKAHAVRCMVLERGRERRREGGRRQGGRRKVWI